MSWQVCIDDLNNPLLKLIADDSVILLQNQGLSLQSLDKTMQSSAAKLIVVGKRVMVGSPG